MKTTVEISLYPLSENYSKIVTDFVVGLKKQEEIRLETNGLSTQIFGDYDTIMNLLTSEIKILLSEQKAVFVMKIAPGERTKENLSEKLK